MKKAVIFDIDGTLVEHHEAEKAALKKVLTLIETNIECKREVIFMWRQTTIKYLDEYMEGKITYKQQKTLRMKHFLKELDIKIEAAQANGLFEYFMRAYEEEANVFNDAIPVLEALKRTYMLGVITNGESTEQRKKLANTGLTNYFSTVVISNEVGILKPNPEIFKYCLTEMDVAPENTLYVGDRPEKDAAGAIAAGIPCAIIDRKGVFPAPTHENVSHIHSLNELTKLPFFKESIGR